MSSWNGWPNGRRSEMSSTNRSRPWCRTRSRYRKPGRERPSRMTASSGLIRVTPSTSTTSGEVAHSGRGGPAARRSPGCGRRPATAVASSAYNSMSANLCVGCVIVSPREAPRRLGRTRPQDRPVNTPPRPGYPLLDPCRPGTDTVRSVGSPAIGVAVAHIPAASGNGRLLRVPVLGKGLEEERTNSISCRQPQHVSLHY